jgi:hypothetical protein
MTGLFIASFELIQGAERVGGWHERPCVLLPGGEAGRVHANKLLTPLRNLAWLSARAQLRCVYRKKSEIP